MVMLQMAEKTTKTKRRALLMAQNEPPTTTSLTRPEPSAEPQPLPGDAFERMRMDPEIQQFRRRLILGASVVGVIVILIVALGIYHSVGKPTQAVNPKGTAHSGHGASGTPAE